MSVTVTLVYPDAATAADALAKLAGVIAPQDRPDAGAEYAQAERVKAELRGMAVALATAPADPRAVFGVGPALPAVPHPTVIDNPGPPGAALPVAALPVPPSPVVPPAPSVPTVPAAVAAAPVPERDAEGVPYDTRIHSSPATLTDKGVWRKKRGVDEITTNRIKAELLGQGAASAPVAVPVPPAPVAVETFASFMARITPKFTTDPDANAKIAAALTPLGVAGFPALGALSGTDPALFARAVAAVDAALA